MPMLPEIKAQWVAALRSGKYEQGRTQLTDKEGNDCCLGVLCKLAIEAGVPMRVELPEGSADCVRYDNEISFLPEVVMEWAGLDSEGPSVKFESFKEPLTVLNDGEDDEDETPIRAPLTFAEIADLIEADDNL